MPNKNTKETVYIVAGTRTPQLKAGAKRGDFSASDLAVSAARELLLGMPFSAEQLHEVIIGCVMPEAQEANIARQVALRVGCGEKVTAWTVQRNCASGLQAIDSSINAIRSGRSELILTGGTEAMSRAPVLWNEKMINWLAQWMHSSGSHRLELIAQLRPIFFKPVFALLKGLTDPIVNLSMGQTAENLAHHFDIHREEMDDYAFHSHARLAKAIDEGVMDDELSPIVNSKGEVIKYDTGLRRDCSPNKLSKLKAVFDRKYGSITAGNSAQVSDGACMLIMANRKMVDKYHLQPLGKIIDCQWQALSPAEMGLGPAHAISSLLKKRHLKLDQIDYWEINEAFAAQVIACVRALNDKDYCRQKLNLRSPVGEISEQQLNIDGGSISLGHPVGASGARIVLHLLNILQRKQARRGIASLCIGGGQGGAILLEPELSWSKT